MATAFRSQTHPNWQPSRFQNEDRDTVAGLNAGRLADALGWFSIGLGIAEVLAPRKVARLVGTRNHRNLMRIYGLREIAAGAGILTQSDPAPWLWSRVGGDILDLASLGAALKRSDERAKTIAAVAAVAGVTALDILCAQKLGPDADGRPGRTIRAEANLLINRPAGDCYRFWHDFENLPRFMTYLRSVRMEGAKRSHWTLNAAGVTAEWDAEIMEDVRDRRIAWRSLPGSEIYNSGSVDFEPAPGGRGTIVRVQIDYGRPNQALATALAKLLGSIPEQMVKRDLRRFKQVMETGGTVSTEGQPAGRGNGATWLDNLAR